MRAATAWQAVGGRAKSGFAAKTLSKHLCLRDSWLGKANSKRAASVCYDSFSCDHVPSSASPNVFSV